VSDRIVEVDPPDTCEQRLRHREWGLVRHVEPLRARPGWPGATHLESSQIQLHPFLAAPRMSRQRLPDICANEAGLLVELHGRVIAVEYP
jgi:hypothetical protein